MLLPAYVLALRGVYRKLSTVETIPISSELNDYLNLPGVGHIFAIRRETAKVKSGERRCETACGVTSGPQRLLTLNRWHWMIKTGPSV